MLNPGRCAALAPLVAAAQSGDPAAIARLLAACQPDARRYARRHCAASDVDDAVQEALLTVARKSSAVRVATAFAGWLFVVIKRECQRLGRVLKGAMSLDDEASGQALAALALRTDDALRLDLVAALESLPAHYRTVLLLRDFEELTIAEIADQLGEAQAGVKSRLHRARMLVREYLTTEPH